MPPLFEIKPVDRDFYESQIREFLPRRIIDVHSHVWTGGRAADTDAKAGRVAAWPARVAAECTCGGAGSRNAIVRGRPLSAE